MKQFDEAGITVGTGEWDAALLGNHRFVVRVGPGVPRGTAVLAELPWRRRDPHPEEVDVAVLSASGRRVRNVLRLQADRERGRLAFEPIDGPGEYALYYLPYGHAASAYYPQHDPWPWRETADPAWAERQRDGRELPAAAVLRYESATPADSFAPMGFTATAAEAAELEAGARDGLLLLAEDRTRPLELTRHLPAAWAGRAPFAPFRGTAQPGEHYAFQLGAWTVPGSGDDPLVDVTLEFPFPARPLTARTRVPAGRLRALWFVVDVPADAAPGPHRGRAAVGGRSVDVELTVAGEPVADGGAGEPALMTRLGWLDSRLGEDDEATAAFTPVEADGDRLRILGRTVRLGADGLPAALTSTFTPEVTAVDGPERQLLAGPVAFTGCGSLEIDAAPAAAGTGRAAWTARGEGVALTASLEADGCLEYDITVERPQPGGDGAVLTVPLRRDAARWVMGLGLQGREVPDAYDWTWETATRNQDALWIGAPNAGLQLSLRDEHYRRPLNTNFYREQPLREPRSWGNGGRGGVRLRADGDRCLLEAYSGPFDTVPEGGLRFRFRLLLTPFKPIEPGRQLAERYFHAPAPAAEAAAFGATVLNVHHATPPAPFINDPLLTADRLRAYTEEAHAAGLRVKIYDTVRELTVRSPEVQALKSLDGEVFAHGPGGGHSWLREHFGEDYVPGWHAHEAGDVAVVTAGMDGSRWRNAYVCGVDRLAREVGVDGLYLDDIAYDRETMKRVRKVLERARPHPLIDIHSANQFNERDGWASSANLYLEHLPYTDRLWLGEYVDYENTDPAYWLVEVSGIPFGVLGEMLEGGGNPWRGMLFAMTGRAPRIDPRPLWRFWDEAGLPGASMTGWWAEHGGGRLPVRTGRGDVLATTWTGAAAGTAVTAVASWAEGDAEFVPEFDKDALGFAPARVTAPAVDGFQEAGEWRPGEPVRVAPNRGLLLVLQPE